MLNDIIKFKIHVQKGLEEYETFVSEEVEGELAEEEGEMVDHTMEQSMAELKV